MFSFFKSSKKPSAISSPESNTPDSSVRTDDFVIVGPSNPPAPLYPSAQLPPAPSPPSHYSNSLHRQQSVQYSYTNNVPFQLNPVLSSRGGEDVFTYKLYEINQLLNNSNPKDYDFKLERSILNQN